MPPLEHATPTEQSAQAATPHQGGFHAELSNMWGPPTAIAQQTQQFLVGVGDGFRQAVGEGASAVGWAAQHPAEAASNVAKETVNAVKSTLSAAVAVGEYVGDHAERGDLAGAMRDAHKTAQVVGHVVSEVANHASHIKAHDLGQFVGHDVLPGAIAAVVVPELAGEGIVLTASAASKLGTIAKEGELISKVTDVFENATSKISVISEKMDALSKKMDALRDGLAHIDRFEHLNPITHEESPVSEAFRKHVKECRKRLEPWQEHLDKNEINVHAVRRLEDIFGAGAKRRPACFVGNTFTDEVTGREIKKGIYIAEKVWHNGDWKAHHPVDVLFNTFHETGHALNAKLKTDLISNSKAFAEAFDGVWGNIDESSSTVQAIKGLGTLERIRDEVFADSFGHLNAVPHPTNEYSNDIRRMFLPVIEHMRGEIKKW